MGSLRDSIKSDLATEKTKSKNNYQTQNKIDNGNSLQETLIKKRLDELLFAPKNPKKELDFINQMFTRGTGDEVRTGLHASAIIAPDCRFCLREQVLSLLFMPNDEQQISTDLKKIFEEGNAIHEKWQRMFLRGGICEPIDLDRTRFCSKFNLQFTPDGIVEINNKKYVVEIKSVNTMQFSKMKTHEAGVKQLYLYEHLTGIHDGFVLAEDKNTQRIKVYYKRYEHEKALPFLSRLFEINELVKERTLPHRKCLNPNCKNALNCRMSNACFNIGKGRIKL